jgi:hypothetical protein
VNTAKVTQNDNQQLIQDLDARFFEDPDEFHPERWTSQRQMVKNASVFQPFSAGLSI